MNPNCKVIFIFLTLFLFLHSCEVEDCGCFNTSPISGKWNGSFTSEDLKIEMFVYLNEYNSNISGSGNLFIQSKLLEYDNTVAVKGYFVSNKVVISFLEIDSISFEGNLTSNKDTIIGLFSINRKEQVPFSLYKFH